MAVAKSPSTATPSISIQLQNSSRILLMLLLLLLLLFIGVSCRDGNNDSLDPSICLSKLYDEYRRLELDQSCHVSCDDVTCQYATSLDAGLCPRNCIGTRRNRNHLIGTINFF